MKIFIAFLLTAITALALPAPIQPQQVAVLYNSSDPSSKELATFYADFRRIPPQNLVGLPLSNKDTISRTEYEKSLRKPLTRQFVDRGWWTLQKAANGAVTPARSSILSLAIMRGVPLKISRIEAPEAEKKAKIQMVKNNEAAVDSELAMMGLQGGAIGGMQNNRYYKKDQPFAQAQPQIPFMLLVGRIDAISVDTCKRMIIDAVENRERWSLGPDYIDFSKKGGGYKVGDDWLEKIVELNAKKGIPTIVDRQPNTLPTNYPMTEAALYFGWYAHHRNGAFLHPDLKMKKGSVITHLHSFSAAQLRSTKKNWSAAILEKGAAATVGNVYEPFLAATHNFDIFHDRLLKGYSLVEAAYMALPVLSWQNVVLGDPLYRPFKHFDQAPKDLKKDREYKAMRLIYRSVKLPDERTRKIRSAAAKMGSGTLYEAVGYDLMEIGEYQQALAFFSSAKNSFKSSADRLRQDLNVVEMLRRQKKTKEAVQTLARAKTETKGQPEQKAVIGLSNILNPPAPKAVKPKKK